jgi:hypothetical protein
MNNLAIDVDALIVLGAFAVVVGLIVYKNFFKKDDNDDWPPVGGGEDENNKGRRVGRRTKRDR